MNKYIKWWESINRDFGQLRHAIRKIGVCVCVHCLVTASIWLMLWFCVYVSFRAASYLHNLRPTEFLTLWLSQFLTLNTKRVWMLRESERHIINIHMVMESVWKLFTACKFNERRIEWKTARLCLNLMLNLLSIAFTLFSIHRHKTHSIELFDHNFV